MVSSIKNMKHPKLFILYASLSKVEQNQLLKFLRSPFFNQREDVIQLAELLKDNVFNEFNDLDSQTIFQCIYPEKPFNIHQYRHLLSFLLKLIESYLIQKELKDDSFKSQFYLLQAFKNRNLSKFTQDQIDSIGNNLSANSHLDTTHYFRFQYQEERFNALRSRKKEEASSSLRSLSDEFDLYFIINKLKQACTNLNHQKVLQSEFDMELTDLVFRWIQERELEKEPMVAAYSAIYGMLGGKEEESEARFEQILSILKLRSTELPKDELRSIFLLTLNYCIHQINTGDRKYLPKTLEMYQVGLKTKALYEGELLSPWTFNNIAAISLKLDQLEWTSTFIETCQKDLPANFRERIVSYNLAELELKKGQPEKAIRILHKVQFTDPFSQLISRISMIKAYYAMEEMTMMGYALDNLKQLIHRKSIHTYHKTLTKNFIKYLKMILNLRPYDHQRKEKLIEKISSTEVVAQKEWLLEQLGK